jgi:SMI1-KNR4 cell-wall
VSQTKLPKLQSFLERIEVVETEQRERMSLAELQQAEAKTGYRLPADYQYFCQEIGTGRAAGFCDLFCMTALNIQDNIDVTADMIDRINRRLIDLAEYRRLVDQGLIDQSKYQGEYVAFFSDRQDAEYIKLLQSALIFASFNSDRVIFWDLRTYDTVDDSYDIYWYDIYTPDCEKPILIGRDFTEFLIEFCYGQAACILIPDFCVEGEPMQVEYVFHPFLNSEL